MVSSIFARFCTPIAYIPVLGSLGKCLWVACLLAAVQTAGAQCYVFSSISGGVSVSVNFSALTGTTTPSGGGRITIYNNTAASAITTPNTVEVFSGRGQGSVIVSPPDFGQFTNLIVSATNQGGPRS